MMPEASLPGDLAPPLRMLEDGGSSFWWTLLAALAGLFVWWRNRRRQARPAAAKHVRPPETPRGRGFAGVVEAILDRAAEHGDYRLACHELAAALRQQTSRIFGSDASTLTAREIADRSREPALGSVFTLLAELQFHRREPGADEVRTIGNLACSAVSSWQPGKKDR